MRIRQVPHIEGNFSTHVFISIDPKLPWVTQVQEKSLGVLNRLTEKPCSRLENLHVSLSRHVFLKPHMIDRFLQRLSEALTKRNKTIIFLAEGYKGYLNDSSNTCFIAIPVNIELSPVIIDLIESVNHVFQEFDLECFYDDPSPHVSLACCSNESGFKFPSILTLDDPLPLSDEELEDLFIPVEIISVSVGREVFSIKLAT